MNRVAPPRIRRLLSMALAALALTAAAASAAQATNAYTQSGNRTTGCAVNWYAQTDLSMSYTKDYDGDGSIQPSEVYSNQGYLSGVSSRSDPPAVHGPGDFMIQHWVASDSAVAFRLPVATDHPMLDVTVRIAAESTNLVLDPTVSTLGLAKYVRFEGNPAYAVEAPAPAVTVDATGALLLHWDSLPAGSANIFGFTGQALDGAAFAPESHYLVGATLTATYVEGTGCALTVPTMPTMPTATDCQRVLAGRTLMPVLAGDITAREKFGSDGEVNADGWGSGWGLGATRTFRLYAATDVDLKDITIVATAAQGLTFASSPIGPVVTGSPVGLGALYGNGYTVPAGGIGTPRVSADGRTVVLTVASMPAGSAVAFNVVGVLDGSGKQLVIDEHLVGMKAACEKSNSCTAKGQCHAYTSSAGWLTDLQTTASPFDGAWASAYAIRDTKPTPASTFALYLAGISPSAVGQTFGAHLQVGPCVAGNGAAALGHYNNDVVTGVSPPAVNDTTEVWLDFTVGPDGWASAVARVPYVPTDGDRSIVIHAQPTIPGTGTAGSRLACLPLVLR